MRRTRRDKPLPYGRGSDISSETGLGMESREFAQLIGGAIDRESKAAAQYEELARKVKRASSKKLFIRLAQEERNHEGKLKALTLESFVNFKPEKMVDLHLSEKIEEPEFEENMTYLQSLGTAIKKEERAVSLYRHLSEGTGEEAKNVFLFLVQEEMNHKFQLESEYHEVKNEYDWNVRPEEV